MSFEYVPQRWQIAIDGKPVSQVFDNWLEAARWATARGYSALEPLAALGSKDHVLIHKQPFETWMDHHITAYELSQIA